MGNNGIIQPPIREGGADKKLDYKMKEQAPCTHMKNE